MSKSLKSENDMKRIGIVVEPEACMGAQCDKNGKVCLIENGIFEEHDFMYSKEYELEYEAGVKGYDSLLDAGIAVSDIGIAMRRIINNAVGWDDDDIKNTHAVISMPSKFPMADHIDKYMKLQKILAEKDKDSQFSVAIYDDLELENLTSFELLEKSAELAGLVSYTVIMRPLAIVYAYEYEYPGIALKEGERGLIYDWNKYYFSASIVEKNDGEIDILWSETIDNPTEGNNFFLYHINEELLKEEESCFAATMDVIHQMCGLSGFYIDTIDAVYLAGDFCNIPSVVHRLEKIFDNVCFMEDNRMTALHGVVRMAYREEEHRKEDEIVGTQEHTAQLEDAPKKATIESDIIESDIEETKEEGHKLGLEEMQDRISLVPTLFKFKKGVITRTSKGIEVDLNRIYDTSIRSKYMQKGNVYNALLPYMEIATSKVYSYRSSDKETQIDFKLRKQPENRMLMMRLVDFDEAVFQYEEKSFAHAVFFSSNESKSKGKLYLNCSFEQYETLEALDENKYLILEDHQIGVKYAFECWIEQLPIPGIDKGIYVYSDGSSNNDTDPEDFCSGYVLNVGTDVYFGHAEGNDSGRNVSAEYLAGTNVFTNLSKITEPTEISLYFDNVNVGYVASGVYEPNKEFGKEYRKAFEDYMNAHPNTKVTFVHTDSHSGIFGNEVADQMAQGKKKDLAKLANGFKESRDKICPKDGSFSGVMKFVRE